MTVVEESHLHDFIRADAISNDVFDHRALSCGQPSYGFVMFCHHETYQS